MNSTEQAAVSAGGVEEFMGLMNLGFESSTPDVPKGEGEVNQGDQAAQEDMQPDESMYDIPSLAAAPGMDDHPDLADVPDLTDVPDMPIDAPDEEDEQEAAPAEHVTQESQPAPEPPEPPVQAQPARAQAPSNRAQTAAALSRETSQLDRLSDFRSPYASAYLEVLEAQEAVEMAKADVLSAEARIGESLQSLVARVEQLLERADRVENSITMASGMLGQQAKLIAKAFRDQLTVDEMDGRATLKTHLLEVADEVANKATTALNQVADEAAAFSGVKAEAAALERVTSVVTEQAKQAGLEKSVLALANVIGRLQQAAERIEQAPAQAPQQQAQQQAQPQWAPEGLGAHRQVTIWLAHHLGTPGILIALAGIGLLGWRLFG